MQYPKLIVVGLLLSFAACGGDRGTGPLSESQAREICRDGCEFDAACGQIPADGIEDCVRRCGTDGAGFVREDAAFELSDCVMSLGCDAPNASCFDELEPLEVHRRWEERCGVQLAQACGQDHDDLCNVDPLEGDAFNNLVLVATPSVVEDMIACLDLADCEARVTCFDDVIESGLDQ